MVCNAVWTHKHTSVSEENTASIFRRKVTLALMCLFVYPPANCSYELHERILTRFATGRTLKSAK
jgi:hypothetical protein